MNKQNKTHINKWLEGLSFNFCENKKHLDIYPKYLRMYENYVHLEADLNTEENGNLNLRISDIILDEKNRNKGYGTAFILECISQISLYGSLESIIGELKKEDKDSNHWEISLPFYKSLCQKIYNRFGLICNIHFYSGGTDYKGNWKQFMRQCSNGNFVISITDKNKKG